MHQFFRRRNRERQDFLPRWDDQWKLFLNIHEHVRYCREFGLQLSMPVGFEAIYTHLPRIYEALFPDVWKMIKARNPELAAEARNLDSMIDWNFEQQQWPLEIIDGILLAGIHSFAPVRVCLPMITNVKGALLLLLLPLLDPVDVISPSLEPSARCLSLSLKMSALRQASCTSLTMSRSIPRPLATTVKQLVSSTRSIISW